MSRPTEWRWLLRPNRIRCKRRASGTACSSSNSRVALASGSLWYPLDAHISLQMTRTIPTASPNRQHLAPWHSPCRRVPARCLLTSPKVLLAHLLTLWMAHSMSFACLIMLAAPPCIFFDGQFSQGVVSVQLHMMSSQAHLLRKYKDDCSERKSKKNQVMENYVSPKAGGCRTPK